MKRKIDTAVIAFILCAAVVPPAGIYSVMAENEDTLQVEAVSYTHLIFFRT